MSLEQFAKALEQAAARVRPSLERGLAEVGARASVVAGEFIGHEMPKWQPLSSATLQGFIHPYGFRIPGKIELGYIGHLSATDPLLRTGAMRHSIKFDVDGYTMVVGSAEKVALWQEMGTVNHLTGSIPPRPFLATGMLQSLPFCEEVFGKIAVSLLKPAD